MMKKIGLILLAVTLCLTLGYGKAQAQPVVVADGGIGDVLLFPIYDVRDTANRTDGWQNYFTIENTSGLWTACHLRFRSWRKSIEVYDHIVLLSPFDVFWGVIDRDPFTDNVKIWSNDTQTLQNSGMIYPPDTTWETNFQDFLLEDCGFTLANGYNVNWEKQAGYVEVIGLWQLDTAVGIAVEDTHNLANVVANLYDDGHAGNINVYDVLEALFYDWPDDAALGAQVDWPDGNIGQDPVAGEVLISNVSARGGPADGPGEEGFDSLIRYGFDCPNVLAGAFQLGDVTNGQFQRGNFIALADFRTAGPPHRDDYTPGGIVFDTNTMFWMPWDLAGPPFDIAPYINESWATTVGPGLRDGDDIVGDQHAILVVDGFNDIWSLDEVEIALAKANIWSDYYNGAFGADYSTDVVLTFPTKHYHWFFQDWPFWNESAPPAGGLNFATVNGYWNALAAYRGGGPGAVESSFGVGILNEPTLDSIARWFLTNYDNGPIGGASNIWDMDENIFGDAVGEPPPGSPWHPVLPAAVDIPHEVNICEVGAALGTGALITDVNGLLDTDDDMGHFQIFGFALNNGQRENGVLYGAAPPYVLPPTGVVILDLVYGAGLDRSTMAPWHYQ